MRCNLLRPLVSLCAAAVLMPCGCQVTLPMKRLLLNGPPTPGPLSSGLTPPLHLTIPEGDEEEAPGGIHETSSSDIIRTAYVARGQAPSTGQDPSTGQTLPAPDSVPAPAAVPSPTPVPGKAVAVNGNAGNLDAVLRQTLANNADILAARERVNESLIALDAALRSCKPQALRKDDFKKPAAEAKVWQRRVDLSKTVNENLQDVSNTYFDWLTALEGEAVAKDLLRYEEKLQSRAKKLAQSVQSTQVVLESIETAVNGRQQYIFQVHQQSEALAAKLSYLMGLKGVTPTTAESLQLIDRVDVSVPVAVFIQQAQTNGPSVQELQGLIGAIQKGVDQARGAQCICAHTGAALVCARLQMGQSQAQQAQLSLISTQLKLKAAVEDAFTAILSGHEQISHAVKTIDHAKETYRIMDLRLNSENPDESAQHNTYQGVLNSITQLSQALSNYLTAVSRFNKAQARLLILLGNYKDCPGPAH